MALRTVVIGRLLQIAESFDVDVIEVIGHTDEHPSPTVFRIWIATCRR